MSNTFGKNLKLTIFGESHSKSIGVVIDGIPPGTSIDFEKIKNEMNRRRPSKNKISTSRYELDEVDIQSGFFNGKTTGASLCGIIKNKNTKSKDYSNLIDNMRPSHSDFPSNIKYKGFNDYRGGGQFSGRLTAPIVFAGAIAKQILEKNNIYIGSHIYSIKDIKDKEFNELNIELELFNRLLKEEIPTINKNISDKMRSEIKRYKSEGDSVGGIVETAIINLPVGLGEPLFDSFESRLSHLLFSIPGVKGIEFGKGFEITKLIGSQANDEFYYDDNLKEKTYSNNNGGILGGLTTSMPVIFKVAFKPTPSISKKQRTINIKEKENVEISIEGRHDPCIVPRALVVVEAVSAIITLDFLLESGIVYE
ncbi:MAG: chorismate synthase [Bacillota bacterium]|nr:chorismate synthase [Bacillota bacterium]